jgi:hypothetical protein
MAPVPDPINPLDNLIRLMLFIFLGLAAFFGFNWRGDVNPPLDGGASGVQPSGSQVLTVIEKVEPLVEEVSNTYQLTLHVTGYQPDGCTFPVQVEQTRDGNTITVKIYRVLPPDIFCTMQLVIYDENIPLDGSFGSGDYTFDVNGTILNVSL